MKKIMTVAACLAVLFSLSACVPTKQSSFSIGPDLTPNDNVEYDFTQIHDDTVSELNAQLQYQFVDGLDITGSNADKMIYVKVICDDETAEEDASVFAAALLKGINDAASTQDITVVRSDSDSFGSLWNKFGIQIDVISETEAEKENQTPHYSLTVKAGEPCTLNPDTETYEKEWYRQLEILNRNAE